MAGSLVFGQTRILNSICSFLLFGAARSLTPVIPWALALVIPLALTLVIPLDRAAAAPAGTAINQHSLNLNERGAKAFAVKDFAQAEKLFKEAISSDPKNLSAVFNYSGVLLVQNKSDAAINILEEYAGRHKKDAGIFVRLGDAYASAKKLSQALKNYEAAFKLEPDYQGLPAKLGAIYALSNKLALAENMYSAAVKQQPKNHEYWANLSSIQLANGKPDEAIVSAKRALRVKATTDTYVTLGTAYEQKADYAKSLAAFERAKELGLNTQELKDKIAQLKQQISLG